MSVIDITRERPLSIKRAAAFMDVTQRTIIRWFDQGLERTKLGGRVYTSRAALQRFASPRTASEPQDDGHPGPSDVADNEYLERIGA